MPPIVNLAPPGRRPGPEKLSPLAAVWRGLEALLGRVTALEARRPREVVKGRISDAGTLVLCYSDGTEDDLGLVVGRDGVSPPPVEPVTAAAPQMKKTTFDVTKHDAEGRVLQFVKTEETD